MTIELTFCNLTHLMQKNCILSEKIVYMFCGNRNEDEKGFAKLFFISYV